MKLFLLPLLLFSCQFHTIAQEKTEEFRIGWPPEYDWKVVSQKDDSIQMSTWIIPGNENVNTASIIGVMRLMKAVQFADSEETLNFYRSHIDSGTVLTVLDKQDSAVHRWVLFKVETPKTNKYPEAESDLYFVIQGEYGVFESYVAIKEASLSRQFVKKWTKILKSGELTKQ